EGAAATIALDRNQPVSDAIGTSLRLDVTQASDDRPAGVANEGYWGIPVKPHTRYRASFYAKAAPGAASALTASIQSADGSTVYASGTVTGLTESWKQYELTLETGDVAPTTEARYALTASRP